jgi:hypothetical protein
LTRTNVNNTATYRNAGSYEDYNVVTGAGAGTLFSAGKAFGYGQMLIMQHGKWIIECE